MNIIKRILLVLIGILLPFLLCEVLLCIFKYEPLPKIIKDNNFDFDKFVKWAYVDIHEPFFKIEKDSFCIQREDIWIPRKEIKKYSINKDKNKKRIFILGESVARLYQEDILERELLKYFDDVEIINVGMGAYDSYRIEKISKEISNLNPDYIVVCIGNNDGTIEYYGSQLDPVDINYLPYKYPVLKCFKTICLLLNLFYPEIKLTKDMVEPTFQKNIIKIIENLKDTNIIFCDLPNNEYHVETDVFEDIKQNVSKKRYYEKVWKNSFEYSQFIKRIDFLKQISEKYKNVYITNLTNILRDYTDNEFGYNIFNDDCHFSNTTYLLLSKLITQIIVKEEKNLEFDLDLSKQQYNEFLMNEIKKTIALKGLRDIPKNSIIGFYSNISNKLKILYRKDKTFFEKKYEFVYKKFLENSTYTNYVIMLFYINVLQYNQEFDESKKILNKLITICPNNFEAYLFLGYIEYKNNNFKEADKYFSKAKELNEYSDIDVAFLKELSQEK